MNATTTPLWTSVLALAASLACMPAEAQDPLANVGAACDPIDASYIPPEPHPECLPEPNADEGEKDFSSPLVASS